MIALLLPARALIDPADGVPRAVQERRFLGPLFLLAATTAFAGTAFALRWDAGPSVLGALEAAGQLKGMPEADLAEKVVQTERLRLVTGIARGLFAVPVEVLALAFGLSVLGWLLGRPKTRYSTFLTVVAVGLLPVALGQLLFGLVALWQLGLTEERAATLLPSSLAAFIHVGSPKLVGLFRALDFFRLWAAVLIGLGFAAATGMRRTRGILVGLLLFAAYVGVFGFALGAGAATPPPHAGSAP